MGYEHLLSPIRLRGLTLPNRIVLPPMGTLLCDEQCYVAPALIDYHVARAEGGCGLNFLECTNVWAMHARVVFRLFVMITIFPICAC